MVEQIKPTAFKVAADYIQTPGGIQNMVIRPVVHGLKLTQLAATALASTVNGPRELFRLGDHLLYWVTYPNRLRGFDRAVKKLVLAFESGSVVKVASKISKFYVQTLMVVGLIADAIKNLAVREIITLSSTASLVIAQISFLGNVALFMLSLHGMKKEVKKLLKNEAWTPPFNLALINLVGKVLLAVVAVLAILSTLFVISAWIILAVGVGLMVTSITGHFYEKIHLNPGPKTVAL